MIRWLSLHNLGFTRILRLVMGAVLLAEGFRSGQGVVFLLAGVLLVQGIFNVGCCGTAGCASPPIKVTDQAPAEITFEEVKQTKP